MQAPDLPLEWRVSPGLTDYAQALREMEARADAVRAGAAPELVWLLEHPPTLTAGTSAREADLVQPGRFPIHAVGRGGKHTYHGPGQRVGYLVLDLDARGRDVRRFVHGLEGWLIATLSGLGVAARAEAGRVGIWVDDPARGEAKIGAIGVRVRRWVTLHGFALNVTPDLDHFDAIIPCGLAEHQVTSLAAMGVPAGLEAVDAALQCNFSGFLGSLRTQPNGP